jgi:peptide/nickel transport system substrate-binding protein
METKTRRSSAGGSSRRQFLRTTAGGLVAASAVPLIGGRARAATPKKGGTLRIGIADGGTTDTLDLSKVNGSACAVQANRMIRGYLVQLDIDSQPEPSLAESWEPSPDAKSWHFKLRKGIEFSNGKPITQDDVIFSLNLHRGEKSKSGAKPLVAQIADIKKDGSDGLVFELADGIADFPVYLTDYHLAIGPQNDQGVMVDDVSSGPYALEKFDPGVSLIAKRFANYWDGDAAKFNDVKMTVINDVVARTNALLSNTVDVINRVDVKTAGRLGQTPGIKLTRAASGYHAVWAMDVRKEPFGNNDVRLALKYAIDREQILKTVYRGYGVVANDQPISPVYRYHADIPQRTYDPDKARFHAKKAGLPDLKVALSVSDALEFGPDMAALYQDQAKRAGITIDLIREPADGYWDKVWLVKPFVGTYWWGRSTADQMLTVGFATGAPWNDAHWGDPKLDAIIKQARGELDSAKRAELYREAQIFISDNGGSVIPIFADFLVATRDTLTNGGKMSGAEELDGWRFAERWWFA